MTSRRPSTPRVRVPRAPVRPVAPRPAAPARAGDDAAGTGPEGPGDRPAPHGSADDGTGGTGASRGTGASGGPGRPAAGWDDPADRGRPGGSRRRGTAARRPGGTRPAGPGATPGTDRRPMISLRALGLLLVVVVALAVLYPTIRHAVAQREELRSLTAQVEEARVRTEALERQQRLWADPEYVRVQARDRLGYVVPGERTFVVVDPQTVTGTVERDDADLIAERARERAATSPWYLTVWESVNIAGAAPADSAQEPVGTGDAPRPAPTPSEVAPPPGVGPPTTERGDD